MSAETKLKFDSKAIPGSVLVRRPESRNGVQGYAVVGVIIRADKDSGECKYPFKKGDRIFLETEPPLRRVSKKTGTFTAPTYPEIKELVIRRHG